MSETSRWPQAAVARAPRGHGARGGRFSLRTIMLVTGVLALVTAVVLRQLTDDHRFLRSYTLSNNPAGAQFLSDLDDWFSLRGFRQVVPRYDRWPRQLYAREVEEGAEYVHYVGAIRGTAPYFVDVRTHARPDGSLTVRLSWGYESTLRVWERSGRIRRGDEFFDELAEWCEAYPSRAAQSAPK
jgi:hypothetical protein